MSHSALLTVCDSLAGRCITIYWHETLRFEITGSATLRTPWAEMHIGYTLYFFLRQGGDYVKVLCAREVRAPLPKCSVDLPSVVQNGRLSLHPMPLCC